MRESTRLPGIRRAAAVVVAAAVVLSVAAPVTALAATRTTIRLSSSYMSKAKRVTISGVIRPKRAGKVVNIYILRPGMTKWSFIGSKTTNKRGQWSMKYMPRTTGKYRYRATYGSRTAARLLRIRAASGSTVLLKSTTSTKDSGLFDAIAPTFLARYPQITLNLSSVGSGESISHTVGGNGDLALAHDFEAEIAGVATGVLFNRRPVMYNDFLVVGARSDGSKSPTDTIGLRYWNPPHNADPAIEASTALDINYSPTSDAVQAFKDIWGWGEARQTKVWFYSRGDRSGTHAAEGRLWAAAGYGASIWKHDPLPKMTVPFHTWYTHAGTGTGAGMASTLSTTNNGLAYTLVDRGTWEFQKASNPKLLVVAQNPADTYLKNPYHVLESYKSSNPDGAGLLADWLCSAEGQAAIAGYGRYTFGKALFIPNAN
jgi:tungstate transport system substrate-binding protein